MARYFNSFKRGFRKASYGVSRKLKSARRTATKHRKKAKTLTTILMLGGAYLAYDKLIKK